MFPFVLFFFFFFAVFPLLIFCVFLAFAVNVNVFLSDPTIELDPSGAIGYLETNLLSKIAKSRAELEGRANSCKDVSCSL